MYKFKLNLGLRRARRAAEAHQAKAAKPKAKKKEAPFDTEGVFREDGFADGPTLARRAWAAAEAQECIRRATPGHVESAIIGAASVVLPVPRLKQGQRAVAIAAAALIREHTPATEAFLLEVLEAAVHEAAAYSWYVTGSKADSRNWKALRQRAWMSTTCTAMVQQKLADGWEGAISLQLARKLVRSIGSTGQAPGEDGTLRWYAERLAEGVPPPAAAVILRALDGKWEDQPDRPPAGAPASAAGAGSEQDRERAPSPAPAEASGQAPPGASASDPDTVASGVAAAEVIAEAAAEAVAGAVGPAAQSAAARVAEWASDVADGASRVAADAATAEAAASRVTDGAADAHGVSDALERAAEEALAAAAPAADADFADPALETASTVAAGTPKGRVHAVPDGSFLKLACVRAGLQWRRLTLAEEAQLVIEDEADQSVEAHDARAADATNLWLAEQDPAKREVLLRRAARASCLAFLAVARRHAAENGLDNSEQRREWRLRMTQFWDCTEAAAEWMSEIYADEMTDGERAMAGLPPKVEAEAPKNGEPAVATGAKPEAAQPPHRRGKTAAGAARAAAAVDGGDD